MIHSKAIKAALELMESTNKTLSEEAQGGSVEQSILAAIGQLHATIGVIMVANVEMCTLLQTMIERDIKKHENV